MVASGPDGTAMNLRIVKLGPGHYSAYGVFAPGSWRFTATESIEGQTRSVLDRARPVLSTSGQPGTPRGGPLRWSMCVAGDQSSPSGSPVEHAGARRMRVIRDTTARIVAVRHPTSEAPEPAGRYPSAISKMVCAGEAQHEIAEALGLKAVRVTTPTWVDDLYSCTYQYANGSFSLSVKELSSWNQTYTYSTPWGAGSARPAPSAIWGRAAQRRPARSWSGRTGRCSPSTSPPCLLNSASRLRAPLTSPSRWRT